MKSFKKRLLTATIKLAKEWGAVLRTLQILFYPQRAQQGRQSYLHVTDKKGKDVKKLGPFLKITGIIQLQSRNSQRKVQANGHNTSHDPS